MVVQYKPNSAEGGSFSDNRHTYTNYDLVNPTDLHAIIISHYVSVSVFFLSSLNCFLTWHQPINFIGPKNSSYRRKQIKWISSEDCLVLHKPANDAMIWIRWSEAGNHLKPAGQRPSRTGCEDPCLTCWMWLLDEMYMILKLTSQIYQCQIPRVVKDL